VKMPKVGLLPLFLELYDKPFPQLRAKQTAFASDVADALKKGGAEVVVTDLCSLESHFDKAVIQCEREQVDSIVTLHLCYSPSGEAAGPLCRTRLPIIMFNATPISFGQDAGYDELIANHGIHGVQDLSCVLARMGKKPNIVTGRVSNDNDIAEVISWARAASAASALRSMRVGITGNRMQGMDDFAVDFDELKAKIGPEVVAIPVAEIEQQLKGVSDDDVEKQMAVDSDQYELLIDENIHSDSVRTYLALMEILRKGDISAYTFNFEEFAETEGIVVPFYAACRMMVDGIGFAGEGDVLTASLVGALSNLAEKVEFVEMFCPDFDGRNIFMSHMGESNPAFAAKGERASIAHQAFPFGKKDAASFRFRHQPGEATLVSLAPAAEGRFRLIISGVDVVDAEPNPEITNPQFRIQPRFSVEDFLTAYSDVGGTHHLAMIQGDAMDVLNKFAVLMGFDIFEV